MIVDLRTCVLCATTGFHCTPLCLEGLLKFSQLVSGTLLLGQSPCPSSVTRSVRPLDVSSRCLCHHDGHLTRVLQVHRDNFSDEVGFFSLTLFNLAVFQNAGVLR